MFRQRGLKESEISIESLKIKRRVQFLLKYFQFEASRFKIPKWDWQVDWVLEMIEEKFAMAVDSTHNRGEEVMHKQNISSEVSLRRVMKSIQEIQQTSRL
jgi:hypothetical protein